jgi:uncharacterized protein (TIGR00251 family)
MTFWRAVPDGVTVTVKVQPRARRAGLFGVMRTASGSALKIAVTEAPEDGKANHAVRVMLADALHRPPSAVRVLTGEARREKVLAIDGDTAALEAALRAL